MRLKTSNSSPRTARSRRCCGTAVLPGSPCRRTMAARALTSGSRISSTRRPSPIASPGISAMPSTSCSPSCSLTAARSRRRSTFPRCSTARSCGASCCRNPRAAPTLPGPPRGPSCATASGISTGLRSGLRAGTVPTWGCVWPAPIPPCASTQGLPCSW